MRKRKQSSAAACVQLRNGREQPFRLLGSGHPLGGGQEEVYRELRQAVPIVDAAIGKLVRLTGGFRVDCAQGQEELRRFLRTVPVGRGQVGIDSFLAAFLDSMLTYGRAVGEMLVCDGELKAVCWGDVKDVSVQEGDSPLDFALGVYENGQLKILPRQNLLLFASWNAGPDAPYGASLLQGMPFLADILMKIYNTIGVNWERAGNVRYSVVCKPSGDGELFDAQQRAEQMAAQWSKAMQEGSGVRDFVAVGDVEIKVIGADGKILDSEIPVRQILEQLIAKTGLPPFLLGLSWASTERMSAQQSDLLTSELWAIRRSVQPVLEKICRLWLRLHGFGCEPQIVWDEISLQDMIDGAHAELYLAQADKLRKEMQHEDQ